MGNKMNVFILTFLSILICHCNVVLAAYRYLLSTIKQMLKLSFLKIMKFVLGFLSIINNK